MRVAFVSPWNKTEGLAVYSRWLTDKLEKLVELRVFPLDDGWNRHSRLSLPNEVNQYECLHLQHELALWGSFTHPFKSLYFEFMGKVRIPKIITFHTVDLRGETWKRWGWWGRNRFVKMHALPEKSIVHSQFLKDGLVKFGIAPEKVEVIPLGIPKLEVGGGKWEVGKEGFGRKLKNEGERIIAIFGFINPDKGYEVVLEAIRRLPPDVVFVIAGGIQDESNREYFKQLQLTINDSTINHRVIITGFLAEEQALSLLSASDVVLFPRRHVNASLELSLAIGMNKPILASNLPYFREINNRVPCLEIFELNKPDDFYFRLRELLENEGLQARLIEMTKIYASQYSWERIAKQTVEVYRQTSLKS